MDFLNGNTLFKIVKCGKTEIMTHIINFENTKTINPFYGHVYTVCAL